MIDIIFWALMLVWAIVHPRSCFTTAAAAVAVWILSVTTGMHWGWSVLIVGLWCLDAHQDWQEREVKSGHDPHADDGWKQQIF